MAQMDRARFIGTTAGFVFASAGRFSAAAGASANRSLWVWRTPLAEASDLAAFARQYRFGTVFLSLQAADRDALEAGNETGLQALRVLKDANLAVHCVAGDPSWVKRSRPQAPESVRKLLDAHAAHGILDGIALDLEPHTLPEWKDDDERPALARTYVELLALIRSAAAARGLPVLATVHPTYAKYPAPAGDGGTLLQSAARSVDATDLMAYRNAAATLESFGGAAMTQLAEVAKPWWLGVSTHANSPAGTSYATLPRANFFPAVDATSVDIAKLYGSGFQGISVEDYRNTKALLTIS